MSDEKRFGARVGCRPTQRLESRRADCKIAAHHLDQGGRGRRPPGRPANLVEGDQHPARGADADVSVGQLGDRRPVEQIVGGDVVGAPATALTHGFHGGYDVPDVHVLHGGPWRWAHPANPPAGSVVPAAPRATRTAPAAGRRPARDGDHPTTSPTVRPSRDRRAQRAGVEAPTATRTDRLRYCAPTERCGAAGRSRGRSTRR